MANKTFNTRVKNKRDTESNWENKNPVLLDGEVVVVTTTSGDTRFKVGDGKKTYKQLPFQDQETRDLIPSVDSSLSDTSTNPVQNKIVNEELNKKMSNNPCWIDMSPIVAGKQGSRINFYYAGYDKSFEECTSSVVEEPAGTLRFNANVMIDDSVALTEKNIKSLMPDYVIEQGLTGKWMWRKWASGVAEMWATFDSDSLEMTSQTWGPLYTASWMGRAENKAAREYPFAFTANPIVSATPTVGSGNIWIATNTENDIGTRLTHAPAYQCVRASDATVNSPQISYYVIGKYK